MLCITASFSHEPILKRNVSEELLYVATKKQVCHNFKERDKIQCCKHTIKLPN